MGYSLDKLNRAIRPLAKVRQYNSKQHIIYFLIHTLYMSAKFGDNPSLIILENL